MGSKPSGSTSHQTRFSAPKTNDSALTELVPFPMGTRDYCGALNIRIDQDGYWHYNNKQIKSHALMCLFASTLLRDSNGIYWLKTEGEVGYIKVDNTPFVVRNIFVGGKDDAQTVSIRINTDEIITLGADHPIRFTRHNRQVQANVLIRNNLEARFTRDTLMELITLSDSHNTDPLSPAGFWSDGVFFPLGSIKLKLHDNEIFSEH